MRKLLFASLYALVVAGFGFAIAANITKSVQLSQDPSGPIGFDTQSSVYFPAHVNGAGSVPTIGFGLGTSPVITGTDLAGNVQEGTGAVTTGQVSFRTAFASSPFCVANGSTGVTPLGIVATPNGFTITHVSNTNQMSWSYICIGGNAG